MVVVCDFEVKLFNGILVCIIFIFGFDIFCLCFFVKDRFYYIVESNSFFYCVFIMGWEVFKYCYGDLICLYGVVFDCGD